MKKRTLIFALLSLLIIERGAKAEGVIPQYWGRTTHQLITEKAIKLLIEKGGLTERQKRELKDFKEEIKKGSYP
jgi:hypothetical protein